MTLGDKVKKTISIGNFQVPVKPPWLEEGKEWTKTVSINFTLHGEGADKIDWAVIIQNLSNKDTPFTIERGCVNIGYSEKIIKIREEK